MSSFPVPIRPVAIRTLVEALRPWVPDLRLVRGDPSTHVTGATDDSRQAAPGLLFCALPGTRVPGARYVESAVQAGCAAVLSSSAEVPGTVPLLVASDVRHAAGWIAAWCAGLPSEAMDVVGVTGTNGKTTVAALVGAMARQAARPFGMVGTVSWEWPGHAQPSTHTTPGAFVLQPVLARMRDAGARLVAMEVSSHALDQHRVAGVRFRAAAFTQLTRDHLDYHGTLQAYEAAKARLFARPDLHAPGFTAVVGTEDEAADRMAQAAAGQGARVWRTGLRPDADITVESLRLSLAGFEGDLVTPMGRRRLHSPLVGRHNVLNALNAAGLALAAGIHLDDVAAALAATAGAPGRLEPVPDPAGRRVFVDYAHTDDALTRVIAALRAHAGPQARLITVFGCGGDRDRGKRPLMGLAAASGSDLTVVTSDNPRTEDPAAILADIEPGVVQAGAVALGGADADPVVWRRRSPEPRSGARGYVLLQDRAAAIGWAVAAARPGDIVLIAGKGHETQQIIGTTPHRFDDREQAARALAAAPVDPMPVEAP